MNFIVYVEKKMRDNYIKEIQGEGDVVVMNLRK